MTERNEQIPQAGGVVAVQLPKPTAWPMVLGLGVTLMIAGLITHVMITVLGVVLTVRAIFGWFACVLPHEEHVTVYARIGAEEAVMAAAVEPALIAEEHVQSTQTTYSFISGIEAGVAGGLAMAAAAALYGVLKFGSVWYAVNLMAASSFIGWSDVSDGFLAQFHLSGLLVGVAIHALVALLVGLLYASVLPIFPRYALVTGGVITPIVWTGLAWALMQSVTPMLGARVNWLWFVASQIAYGVVAALVIGLRVKIRSDVFQQLPFSERAGIHANEAHSSNKHEVE